MPRPEPRGTLAVTGASVAATLKQVATRAANITATGSVVSSNVFQGGGGPVRIVRQIWGTVRGMVIGIVRTNTRAIPGPRRSVSSESSPLWRECS